MLTEQVGEVTFLNSAFRNVGIDALVLLVCRFHEYSSMEQIRGRVAELLGYAVTDVKAAYPDLPASLSDNVKIGYLESNYILTKSGLDKKTKIFHKIVDSLPEDVRAQLLKMADK